MDLGFSEDFKISGKRDGLYPNEGSMVEALPCSYCLKKGELHHILRSYKELSLEFSNIWKKEKELIPKRMEWKIMPSSKYRKKTLYPKGGNRT